MTRADKLATADLNAALRLRYGLPEWVIMFEVAASTGFAGRYADAIAMNLYPSRGLAVHGFECKVSRPDWQRELKKPEKAEAIAAYCDYWWIVAAPGLVKTEELPMGWGLQELHPKGLKVIRQAAKRDTHPLDRGFVAAMLRRAQEVDSATLTKLVEAGLERRTSYLRGTHTSELDSLKHLYEPVQTLLTEAEEKSGLKLKHFFRSDDLAAVLRLAHSLSLSSSYGPLQNALAQLRQGRHYALRAEASIESALTQLGITPEQDTP